MFFDRVLPLAMLLALASGYNYCNNKTHLCNMSGSQHFICRLDTELPSYRGTRYEDSIPDNRFFQKEVLILLNNFRDMLASGQVMNSRNITFPSAKRMRRLIWDSELAYLARVHVATVSLRHTECRSTLRFPLVGEIIAATASPIKNKFTIVNILKHVFKPMWMAKRQVEDPKKFIESFQHTNNLITDDFALIVNDRASRVGCGIAMGSNCSYKNSRTGYCHFVTCYFDHTNILESPVYLPGMPTSGCDEWQTVGSTHWSYLCKNLGVIFPNN